MGDIRFANIFGHAFVWPIQAEQNSRPEIMTKNKAVYSVLIALSVGHLINDTIQSLLPAIYPIIKANYQLDFTQIGMLTFVFQMCGSVFQPMVGHYTDKKPMPYSMVVGMGFSMAGLITLALAHDYTFLLVGSAMVGIGSSIFHPEATRLARRASGGQLGFAQAVFVVGGQTGSAIGPLMAVFVIVSGGQSSIAWFSLIALAGMVILAWAGRWHIRSNIERAKNAAAGSTQTALPAITGSTMLAIGILMVLIFSKVAYSASFNSFYTFYLMEKFSVSLEFSQVMLFVFLFSSAIGSLLGGWLSDRIGRRIMIWFSILGALPFALMLPFVDLFWTGVLTVIINLIMSSALASILVYAMELLPGRVGMIGGLFYGLAFGLGGIAAAALGKLADATSINTVYFVSSFLPAFGLLAWFLPEMSKKNPA